MWSWSRDIQSIQQDRSPLHQLLFLTDRLLHLKEISGCPDICMSSFMAMSLSDLHQPTPFTSFMSSRCPCPHSSLSATDTPLFYVTMKSSPLILQEFCRFCRTVLPAGDFMEKSSHLKQLLRSFLGGFQGRLGSIGRRRWHGAAICRCRCSSWAGNLEDWKAEACETGDQNAWGVLLRWFIAERDMDVSSGSTVRRPEHFLASEYCVDRGRYSMAVRNGFCMMCSQINSTIQYSSRKAASRKQFLTSHLVRTTSLTKKLLRLRKSTADVWHACESVIFASIPVSGRF